MIITSAGHLEQDVSEPIPTICGCVSPLLDEECTVIVYSRGDPLRSPWGFAVTLDAIYNCRF